MKRTLFSLVVVCLTLTFSAVTCQGLEPDPTPDVTYTYGAYFLNSGTGTQDDAEITQFNILLAYVNQNSFALYNDGKKLGNDARDIRWFGGRLYVTLAGSKSICVIDSQTFKEVGRISLRDHDGNLLTPAYMEDFENSLLVSFDEGRVASVDTASLTFSTVQDLGMPARRIAVANQKLYVVCGPDDEGASHTVKMLNPVDLHVMKTIDVQPNPSYLAVEPTAGELYLISDGDGEGTSSVLQRIDTDNEEVSVIKSVKDPVMMAAGPSKSLVIYVKDDSDLGGNFVILNTESEKIAGDFIRDGSYVKKPSAIMIDQNTGSTYIADDSTPNIGTIQVFTSYGQLVTTILTGAANPCAVAFFTGKAE